MKKNFKNLIQNKTFLAILLACIVIASVAGATAGLGKKQTEDSEKQTLDLNTPGTVAQLESEEASSGGTTSEQEVAKNDDITEASEDTDPAETQDNASGGADAEESPSDSALPADTDASESGDVLSVDTDNVTAEFAVTFDETSYLSWPVVGEVLMMFSPDTTVYFATLEQYRTNDAILIQSDLDASVRVPHHCRVSGIGYQEDIGNYVCLDLGDGYEITLGQLKDISVNLAQVVPEGTVIASIAEPTRYYTVEGYHLYMKMTLDGVAIDPLDYLQ